MEDGYRKTRHPSSSSWLHEKGRHRISFHSEDAAVSANKKSGKVAAFVEMVVAQVGLLFFGFMCMKFFRNPSELFEGTGFEDLSQPWKIILGRAAFLVVIGSGLYMSIRSIVDFSHALKAQHAFDAADESAKQQ
jgi:hypothetical protein